MWTYVSPAGKVFRWDVAQKAQVGSVEIDSAKVGAVESSGSSAISMTVLNGLLYIGRLDGAVLVVDAALEPGAASLLSAFRPHDSNVVSLVAVGGGTAEASSHNLGEETARKSVKRTPSYRGVGGGVDGYSSSSSAMTKSTSSIGGVGAGSGCSSSSGIWNPSWWVSHRGDGAQCPLMLSVGRGYRSLVSAKCPTAAFSPAAVTQSSGVNRNKTFVLSWFATQWDQVEDEEL